MLEKNPYWDASTDPARTQYPDGYDFKLQQPSEKIDQIMLADTGSGQTTLTYDDLLAPDFQQMKQKAPDRLTLGGSPCTYYWAPDNRKITNKKVREALSWAYPYKNAILAAGLIPGVNAIPATNLMPPGVPGRTPYNVTGRQGFQTDPAKAKALLKSANAMGYEIKFLFRTDDPVIVKAKDAIVKGLTEARLQGHPGADHDGELRRSTRQHHRGHQRPLGRLVLGLAVRFDLDADRARVDQPGQDPLVRVPTTRRSATRPSTTRWTPSRSMPLDQQADAWNALDKQIATKYFPLFTDLLHRHRPGPRVEDQGRLR